MKNVYILVLLISTVVFQSCSRKNCTLNKEIDYIVRSKSYTDDKQITKFDYNELAKRWPIQNEVTLIEPNLIKSSSIAIVSSENKSELIEKYPEILQQKSNNKPTPTTPTKLNDEERKIPGGAIAGFVLGLISLFFVLSLFLLPLGVITGITGTIVSGIAIGKIYKAPEKYKGKGFAFAGLITSIVAILFTILVIALFAYVASKSTY